MDIAVPAFLVASAVSGVVLMLGVGLAIYRGWRARHPRAAGRRRVHIR